MRWLSAMLVVALVGMGFMALMDGERVDLAGRPIEQARPGYQGQGEARVVDLLPAWKPASILSPRQAELREADPAGTEQPSADRGSASYMEHEDAFAVDAMAYFDGRLNAPEEWEIRERFFLDPLIRATYQELRLAEQEALAVDRIYELLRAQDKATGQPYTAPVALRDAQDRIVSTLDDLEDALFGSLSPSQGDPR